MKKESEKFQNIGKIEEREITQEMTDSYIDYAMSVIVSRALPDVRDGLKPVQRRILYVMLEEGLKANSKFRKSATVVGSCLARYHPHGDIPVYEALVRMAQDFSLRYPLIEGQGNFGSIDSDPPAAQRYTECRLSPIGQEMLKDIEKETVDFTDNYDATRKEPVVLPSPLPQLLLNGSVGIAVGMATNIPPHNLSEVCEALIYLIENPKAQTQELLKFIKGPDFPTGGIVCNAKELKKIYAQGKGAILVRGKAEILKEKGKEKIIITEIPFQISKSALLEKFAKLVETKQIQGIKDIRDESDKEGMRIVIELQRGAFAQKILNSLYKFTDLQKAFHLNMIALVDGIQPKLLSLGEILRLFLDHRIEIITRKTRFELKRAKERLHILEGFSKCLAKIDSLIETIKKSQDREKAKENLMKKFKLTEIQALAILEMKLSQLSKLEREKIEKELKEKRKLVKELEALLKSPKKIKEELKKELIQLKEKYGDERKTKIFQGKIEEISTEDLIPLQETIVILSEKGFIKRLKPSSYRAQKRGGKGILGTKIGKDDFVSNFILAKSHDLLLFFTDSGRCFQIPVFEIPETTRLAHGKHLANFIDILSTEKVVNLLPRSKEEKDRFLIMATKNGLIKKVSLEDFSKVKRSGIFALRFKKGDSLKAVQKTSGKDLILLVTAQGKIIIFKEKEIKETGRQAKGIFGIRLAKGDKVVAMDKIESGKIKNQYYLLTISEKGFGKKTPLFKYKIQKRGGKGIIAAKINQKTGNLAKALILKGDKEHLILVSQKGQVIKIPLNNLKKMGRATMGLKLINLSPGDKVKSAICI